MASVKPYVKEELTKQIEPKLVNAELQIKVLIKTYLLNRKSDFELFNKIDMVIMRTMNALPQDTPDKDIIYQGLRRSSIDWYSLTKNKLNPIIFKLNIKLKEPVSLNKIERAAINITPEKIIPPKQAMTGLLPDTMGLYKELNRVNVILSELATYGLKTDYTLGETPMSIFAKLEMTNRFNVAMTQYQDKLETGEQIVRFSQHRDPSERCQHWQGKAVHLLAPAINDKMETGIKLKTGEIVYSYQGITNQVDEYGNRNNIHVGFNCRHYLKPVADNKPEPYSAAAIKAARASNYQLRNMERAIRNLKKKYKLLIGDKEKTSLSNKITDATKLYFKFAEVNKVVPYGWRLEV
jgi:hypothetical protein